MSIVSEKPLIEILSPEEQHDRFDINYYLPEFIHAERYIENCDIELTTLGDVMTDDASYGVLPPSSSYLEEGGISLVRSSNVSNSGIDYESAVRVPSEWINSERARIKSNDVLISIKGARAFFDMCVASDNPPDAIVNGSIFRFQCKEDFDPKFVVLWLLSKPIQSMVFRERTNLGISYISQDILKNIPFPKIENEKQQLILRGYNAAVEMKDEMISSLNEVVHAKSLARNVISDIYRDKLGMEEPSAPVLKVRVVDSSKIQDRLDWKTYDPNLISDAEKLAKNFPSKTFVRDVARIKDTYKPATAYSSDDVKLIRVKLYGKGAELRETRDPDSISGPVAQADSGEVVVSRIDCTQGAVAVVPDELNGGVVSKEFFLIRLDETKLRTQLFVRILLHKRYVQYLLSFRTGATNRLRLDKDVLMELPLPKLPTDQQDTILDELRIAEDKLFHVESIEAEAHRMADGLVELALDNVIDLGEESYLSELSETAKAIKQKLLKQVKEALQ